MEPTEPRDLFDVKINSSGKYYLRKFASVIRIVILAGIFVSCIHIASSVLWLLEIKKKYPPVAGTDTWIEYKTLPFYLLVYCALLYPQLFFYWRATKFIRMGLKNSDENTFNKAFRYLLRHAVLALASVLLSTLSYGFELYGYIKNYLK